MLDTFKRTIENNRRSKSLIWKIFVSAKDYVWKLGVFLSSIIFVFSGESDKIKRLRNKYADKRCFIIATGPSLNKTNLSLLKNELTFAVKSYIFSGLDKYGVEPNFYCWSDRLALERSISDFPEKVPEKMISFFPYEKKQLVLNNLKWNQRNICFLRGGRYDSVHNILFSARPDNSGSVVMDYCIPLAIYMGFKEIYLVGCDNSSSNGVLHFDGGTKTLSGINVESIPWDKMTQAFQTVKEYCQEHGIIIKNATVGGNLEVFERVDLADLFKGKK
jgi:hypothetical protein